MYNYRYSYFVPVYFLVWVLIKSYLHILLGGSLIFVTVVEHWVGFEHETGGTHRVEYLTPVAEN